MLQRIQTVYFLIATVLSSLLFFIPYSDLTASTGQLYRFTYSGFAELTEGAATSVVKTHSMVVLLIAIIVFSIIGIALFKNRYLQLRLSIYLMAMALGFETMIIFYSYRMSNILSEEFGGETVVKYNYLILVIPILVFVLIFLARRAISKDEKLVKSYDRIR